MRNISTFNRITLACLPFVMLLLFVVCGFTFEETPPTVTTNTITSGNINVPSTYSCNCVPDANTKVIISTGDTLIVNANAEVYQIEFQANSYLKYTGAYTINTHYQ